jgi:hypothetical protein
MSVVMTTHLSFTQQGEHHKIGFLYQMLSSGGYFHLDWNMFRCVWAWTSQVARRVFPQTVGKCSDESPGTQFQAEATGHFIPRIGTLRVHILKLLKEWQSFVSYLKSNTTSVCRNATYVQSKVPTGVEAVEASTFFRQSAHRWRWGCQPYAPAALYPQEDSWYSFLLEAESTPGLYCGWKD